MKLMCEEEERILIEDGKHTGTIVGLVGRDEPHKYLDFVIEFESNGKLIKINYGLPRRKLTVNNSLGKFCLEFGGSLELGKEIDLDQIFLGRQVEFMTIKKLGKNGKQYANIVKESVHPIKEEVVQ